MQQQPQRHQDNNRVQNPLNLRLTVKKPVKHNMRKLEAFLIENTERIQTSLNNVYFIHFARILRVSDSEVYIITVFDGDFYIYMLSFLKNLGWFFNEILQFVENGEPLIPVGENVEAFSAWAHKNDVPSTLNTPYPTLSVLDIMNNAGLLGKDPDLD